MFIITRRTIFQSINEETYLHVSRIRVNYLQREIRAFARKWRICHCAPALFLRVIIISAGFAENERPKKVPPLRVERCDFPRGTGNARRDERNCIERGSIRMSVDFRCIGYPFPRMSQRFEFFFSLNSVKISCFRQRTGRACAE